MKAICIVCGADINNISPSRWNKNKNKEFCCSRKCLGKHTSIKNYSCVICGKRIYVKPSKLKKEKHGFTCSRECSYKNKSKYSIGENNHQYGLKGKLNASFGSGKRISNYGYVLIYKPEHERANCNGYVFEHILIMEEHVGRKLKFFSKLHKENEVVHHIDFNRKNNSIDNLKLMTRGEHTSLHNKINPQKRNKRNGRFMQVEDLSDTQRGSNGFGSTDR